MIRIKGHIDSNALKISHADSVRLFDGAKPVRQYLFKVSLGRKVDVRGVSHSFE